MGKNYLMLQVLNGRDIILSSDTNSRLVLSFIKDLGSIALVFEKRDNTEASYERVLVDPVTLTSIYTLLDSYTESISLARADDYLERLAKARQNEVYCDEL